MPIDITSIDPTIIEQIQNDGVIQNNGLWRRWITAQTYKCFAYTTARYGSRRVVPQTRMNTDNFVHAYDDKFFDKKDIKYAFQNIAREIKTQKQSTVFPSLITMDMVKQFLNEYKALALKTVWEGKQHQYLLDEVAVSDKVIEQLGFDNSQHIYKSIITGRNGSLWCHEPKCSGWYRSQWHLLSQICNSGDRGVFDAYRNSLTKEHKFKKKTYRLCDVVKAPDADSDVCGLGKIINSIIKQIKTLDDFVDFVDSSVMNILPLAYNISNELPTYTKIFTMVGSYYTMQNMIMFHHFNGMTMEQLNDIANNHSEQLWDLFLDQIEQNNLMDYLIPTQVDEL